MLPSLAYSPISDDIVYLAPYDLNSEIRIMCHMVEGVCRDANLFIDGMACCFWLSTYPQNVNHLKT